MKLLVSELRLRRISLIVWVASVFALVAMITAFYPQIRSDPSLNSLYANMSPAMQALLGGSDLTSPAGYLNTQVFAFFLPAVLLVFGAAMLFLTWRGRCQATPPTAQNDKGPQ